MHTAAQNSLMIVLHRGGPQKHERTPAEKYATRKEHKMPRLQDKGRAGTADSGNSTAHRHTDVTGSKSERIITFTDSGIAFKTQARSRSPLTTAAQATRQGRKRREHSDGQHGVTRHDARKIPVFPGFRYVWPGLSIIHLCGVDRVALLTLA